DPPGGALHDLDGCRRPGLPPRTRRAERSAAMSQSLSQMKTKTKVLIGLGTYLAIAIALLLIFGNAGKNEDFKPQNEFKLPAWVHLKIGPIDLSINRAVFYLFIASVLTIVTMVYIAKRMTQKPNRVQTGVELSYELVKNNILGDNLPGDVAKR